MIVNYFRNFAKEFITKDASRTGYFPANHWPRSMRKKGFQVRACLHGVGGPQVGEVTRLGWVIRLFI